MEISLSARHGDLSPATQQRIRDKVQKLTRYFDRLTAIEVTADLEHRDNPRVELRVSAEHRDDFVATDRAEELMAALDRAMHKMEQQLRRHKQKLTEHRATGLKYIETPAEPPASEQ